MKKVMEKNLRNYMLSLRQARKNITQALHLLEEAESMLTSVIAIREEIGQRVTDIDGILQETGTGKVTWKNTVGDIIQQVFTVPDPHDMEAVWMTPTEVMEELRKRRLIRSEAAKHITPWHIGGALRNLGFVQKKIYENGMNLYRYNVKFGDENIRNTHVCNILYI